MRAILAFCSTFFKHESCVLLEGWEMVDDVAEDFFGWSFLTGSQQYVDKYLLSVA